MSEEVPMAVKVTDEERELLVGSVHAFNENFYRRVWSPVTTSLGLTPEPIQTFRQDLERLRHNLASGGGAVFREHFPILKTALLYKLREETLQHEKREYRTPDKGTKAALLAQIQPLRDLAASAWCEATNAARAPVLSDYLVISQIENVFGEQTGERKREYDEKFRILNSPGMFFADLAHFREQCCELRGRPLSVGYIDIDDFKGFNTRLGEPRVDREVLPVFMRLLEAVTYRHGYAYRYGGDEYVVLLPNRGLDEAVAFFHQFQSELEVAEYGDIGSTPTISVGVCEVRDDSPLTDRQLEQYAAEAKNFAKKEGKNRVAGYVRPPPQVGGLRVFER